jgi:hypothetical protein
MRQKAQGKLIVSDHSIKTNTASIEAVFVFML